VSVIRPAGELTVDRCTFARNGPGRAGVIRVSGGNATIQNSIFAYSFLGVAICRAAGTQQVSHCDFYGNGSGDLFDDNLPDFGVIDTVNANGDSCDGYFNVFRDPMFADTAADDYHLTWGSPCIDAGDPASPPDPDGTVADMGAEYYDHLAADRPRSTAVQQYGLDQNYPNPFNAVTTITFALPSESDVKLGVFDITGRLVATVAEGMHGAGEHAVTFDAAALPSGIYVYRLEINGIAQSRKLVLIK